MARQRSLLDLESMASEFRMRNGVPDDFNLDLADLLRRMKITGEINNYRFVDPSESSRIKGRFVPEINEVHIYENPESTSSNDTKFTIAHEIAHSILHGDFERNRTKEGVIQFGKQVQIDEEEADILAGMLLIPARLLHGLRQKTIVEIAQTFGVSEHLARTRLVQLRLELLQFGEIATRDFGSYLFEELKEFDTGDYAAAFHEMLKNAKRWNG